MTNTQIGRRHNLSLFEFGANDLEEMVVFPRVTVMQSRHKRPASDRSLMRPDWQDEAVSAHRQKLRKVFVGLYQVKEFLRGTTAS